MCLPGLDLGPGPGAPRPGTSRKFSEERGVRYSIGAEEGAGVGREAAGSDALSLMLEISGP
jgi:hypothetical protein